MDPESGVAARLACVVPTFFSPTGLHASPSSLTRTTARPPSPNGTGRATIGGKTTMAGEIRDCLPPDRDPRKPNVVLPKGAIDTHVHVFEPGYKLSPDRG